MAGGMPESALLTDLLKDVSRSFYLTLRVLPSVIRPQIGLAYLLARATDTIADTALLPIETRLGALQALQARIQGSSQRRLNLDQFLSTDPAPLTGGNSGDRALLKASHTAAAERHLLQRIDEALELLKTFPAGDQRLIREVLAIITSGQELDLTRFATHSANQIIALATEADLDDYTYRVAGCVGEFWTRICRAHVFPRAKLNDEFLLHNGVRFGKGLQLVNVLRDLPADLLAGRCYLPAQVLREAQLEPATLLDPGNERRLQPVLRHHREMAAAHLAAGWAYTQHLPWRSVRVRLACAWPLLIGIKTLIKLDSAPLALPQTRVKITRRELQWLMARSLVLYPFPRAWNRLFQTAQIVIGMGGNEDKSVPEPRAGASKDLELGRRDRDGKPLSKS
jgi:farnesyl-diphosphate farnesyltransferase